MAIVLSPDSKFLAMNDTPNGVASLNLEIMRLSVRSCNNNIYCLAISANEELLAMARFNNMDFQDISWY